MDNVGKPKVVTDAGPLIYLALLERFDLLDELFDEVWVPEAVHHEVVRQARNMPGASETEIAVQTGRFRSAKAENMVAVDALLTDACRNISAGMAGAITGTFLGGLVFDLGGAPHTDQPRSPQRGLARAIPVADDFARREPHSRGEGGLRGAAWHPDESNRLTYIPVCSGPGSDLDFSW